MEKDIRFEDATTLTVERTLPGPIERVWAYLTDPDKRARWLGGGVLGQFVGGAVEIHFRHQDLSGDKQPAPEKYRHLEDGATLTAPSPASSHPMCWLIPGGTTRAKSPSNSPKMVTRSICC